MTDEQLKMTIFLKARIRKAAAEIVIQEVLLACFNSYDYKDAETIETVFESDELEIVHKLFETEYKEALMGFLSLEEQKRNTILDEYVTSEKILKW